MTCETNSTVMSIYSLIRLHRLHRLSVKLFNNTFNNFVSNDITSCRSLKTSSTFLNTSSAVINSSTDVNQFNHNRDFRKEFLQNIFVLSQNVLKGKRNINELIEEKDLQNICKTIEDNVKYLRNYELINGLHSFLEMGLRPTTSIIQHLENEILWRAKDMSLNNLLTCLSFHVRFQTTEQQLKVVNELIINLVIKIDNAENDEDIIQMLCLWQSLSPEIITRMELIAIEMIGRTDEDHFKLHSLSYLLVLLAKMNRRTKPLIDAIVNRFNYLTIDPNNYNERFLIRMVSALKQLNYIDVKFLKKSSDLLCNKKFLNSVRPSDRRDLLVSISHSNWSYPRLMDEYIEKIMNTNNDFSAQDFLVFVSSAARLNFHSPSMNQILNNYIIPLVNRYDMDSDSWLLYVWSLSILGCLPINHLNSVMNSDFYNQLLSSCQTYEGSDTSINYKQVMQTLKLLNIKGVAEIEMNQKIDFESVLMKDYEVAKRENSTEKFKQYVLQMLVSYMSDIKTNVLTPYGFAIDAEFIANKDNECLPIKEFGVLAGDPSNDVKQLPSGFKRCALMCFGFNDSLLGESGLVGIHELSVRLLKKMGYNVIIVNQNMIPFIRNLKSNEPLKAIVNKSFD
ncbi:FAST kinase domain-containing protein 4-like [Oppia nitens]|uniref:FAST kinase domain-containing protein 4-like n=1 Tax=Oppia nitens TaxID=1686743 RepID=UPI0023D9E596|nr:FAST kinase domain-containing protein 4-like [Oppia nitens]